MPEQIAIPLVCLWLVSVLLEITLFWTTFGQTPDGGWTGELPSSSRPM